MLPSAAPSFHRPSISARRFTPPTTPSTPSISHDGSHQHAAIDYDEELYQRVRQSLAAPLSLIDTQHAIITTTRNDLSRQEHLHQQEITQLRDNLTSAHFDKIATVTTEHTRAIQQLASQHTTQLAGSKRKFDDCEAELKEVKKARYDDQQLSIEKRTLDLANITTLEQDVFDKANELVAAQEEIQDLSWRLDASVHDQTQLGIELANAQDVKDELQITHDTLAATFENEKKKYAEAKKKVLELERTRSDLTVVQEELNETKAMLKNEGSAYYKLQATLQSEQDAHRETREELKESDQVCSQLEEDLKDEERSRLAVEEKMSESEQQCKDFASTKQALSKAMKSFEEQQKVSVDERRSRETVEALLKQERDSHDHLKQEIKSYKSREVQFLKDNKLYILQGRRLESEKAKCREVAQKLAVEEQLRKDLERKYGDEKYRSRRYEEKYEEEKGWYEFYRDRLNASRQREDIAQDKIDKLESEVARLTSAALEDI